MNKNILSKMIKWKFQKTVHKYNIFNVSNNK